MPRSTCSVLLLSITIGLIATTYLPAMSWAGPTVPPILQQQEVKIPPPPAAYLAWYKLLMIAIVFLIWVKTTDWANHASMKIGQEIEMRPEVWNPIIVGAFLIGLLSVIFVPMFVVGFSIYALTSLTPFAVYWLVRRSRLASRPDLARAARSSGGEITTPPLPQDEGAPIEFSPAGQDDQERQTNLIRARQAPEFPKFKDLLADLLHKRTEVVLLDYTRQGVAGRFQVDGVWHPLPPMEREVGDAFLVSLKSLAGLKAEDRRSKQAGHFQIKNEGGKVAAELQTQGVPTGEKAQIKLMGQRKAALTLPQLGMFPEMVAHLKSQILAEGISIISAPKGEGLTSTWQGVLLNSGQFTRDCVALIPEGNRDSQVENINQREYNSPEHQLDVLRATLLTQPDFFAVPFVETSEMMDQLTYQALSQHRSILLQETAPSAAEALRKAYSRAGNRDAFLSAIKTVTSQKLVRRLCPDCRQEVRVAPDMIKKLGGDPKKQATIHQEYRLPPPEQRVDEKGRPIEFPPCQTCGGLSYLGRIAIYEMLDMTDAVQTLLRQNADAAKLELAAQKSGKASIQQQAYRLVLLGVTSIAEVQRVFKK